MKEDWVKQGKSYSWIVANLNNCREKKFSALVREGTKPKEQSE